MSISPLGAAERHELTEVAADFARKRLAPRALMLDSGDSVAFRECWAGIRELGLERALLPESLGGAGLSTGDVTAPLEELARADAGMALTVLLCNAALLALPAESAAAVPEDERWAAVLVPRTPTPGAHTLRVDIQGGQAILNGQLLMAFAALGADGIVVLSDGEAGRAFTVARDARGSTVRPTPDQMGLRSARAADVGFADTPATGVTASAPQRTLVLWGLAAIARGIAGRAYEIARGYAETRRQGGVPIIEHGAVRSMLAGMTARLRDGHAPTPGLHRDGDSRTTHDELREHASVLSAKVRATDDALSTAIDAVQVLGGSGYMRDAEVEKLMRDARYCQLYPEPNWIVRDRLLELDRQ
jgi:alkylation response protein AidB-like acyl-CoA dehydrogenase